MFFWNSLAFSMIQRMLAIWSLVPLPFLKPAWTSGSSRFMYCWSLAWRILSITLSACAKSLQSCPTLCDPRDGSLIQQILAIWSLVPLPFLNPTWTSGNSYKIFSMTLLAWEMSAVVQWLAHSLVLPFLGIGMKIDLFQTCGHCWVFQICWHIEYNILMASFFWVLNSSTGILF